MLLENLDSNQAYYVYFLKNGEVESYMYTYHQSAASNSQYHHVETFTFVYSNGTNYIEFQGLSFTADFNPIPYTNYNDLTIEFVAV